MSAYKDGNKKAIVDTFQPYESVHDPKPKRPRTRAEQALYEGACLEREADNDGRIAEYEKNWKEGQKV